MGWCYVEVIEHIPLYGKITYCRLIFGYCTIVKHNRTHVLGWWVESGKDESVVCSAAHRIPVFVRAIILYFISSHNKLTALNSDPPRCTL